MLQQNVALYGSRTALLQAQTDRLVQRINLYLALGGSFEPRPAKAALDNAAKNAAIANANQAVKP